MLRAQGSQRALSLQGCWAPSLIFRGPAWTSLSLNHPEEFSGISSYAPTALLGHFSSGMAWFHCLSPPLDSEQRPPLLLSVSPGPSRRGSACADCSIWPKAAYTLTPITFTKDWLHLDQESSSTSPGAPHTVGVTQELNEWMSSTDLSPSFSSHQSTYHCVNMFILISCIIFLSLLECKLQGSRNISCLVLSSAWHLWQ